MKARAGGGADGARGSARDIVADLRAELDSAPDTQRRRRTQDYLRWAEAADEPKRRAAYLNLVAARIAAGLEDRPEPKAPPRLEALATPAKAPTPANPVARFFDDGKRHKPDPCNAAKGIWGRAAKGVL